MEFQPHAFINWLIRCLFSIKRNLHFSGQQSWPAFPYFLFGTENITPLETVVIKILVFGAFIHSLFSKNVQWCTEGMAGEKEGSSYETTPGAAQSAWDNAKGWRGWRGVWRIRNYFVKHKISSYLIYYIFEYVQETGFTWLRILSTPFALLVAPEPEISFSFVLKLEVWWCFRTVTLANVSLTTDFFNVPSGHFEKTVFSASKIFFPLLS